LKLAWRLETEYRELFVLGPRRVGLLLANSAAIRILDFEVDEHSEMGADLKTLQQFQTAEEEERAIRKKAEEERCIREEKVREEHQAWIKEDPC